MQKSHKSTSISDCLAEPHDWLALAFTLVIWDGGVLGHAEALIGGRHGEDEEECMGGAGDEGQKLRLGNAVDIVHSERFGEAELVEEVGHQFWVGLHGDEGQLASIGSGCCAGYCCHGLCLKYDVVIVGRAYQGFTGDDFNVCLPGPSVFTSREQGHGIALVGVAPMISSNHFIYIATPPSHKLRQARCIRVCSCESAARSHLIPRTAIYIQPHVDGSL